MDGVLLVLTPDELQLLLDALAGRRRPATQVFHNVRAKLDDANHRATAPNQPGQGD